MWINTSSPETLKRCIILKKTVVLSKNLRIITTPGDIEPSKIKQNIEKKGQNKQVL